jgi:hypothetical protein
VLPLIDFGNQPTAIIVAGQTSLNPYITFTRASSATRFNSAGLIETVSSDVPRFDFNPVTLQPRGLLMEGARTNLAVQSEDFTTTWGVFQGAVTANTSTSPSGAVNADNWVPTAVSGDHTLNQNLASTDLSVVRTFSMFVKANGLTTYRIYMRNNAQSISLEANFNLTNQTITDSSTGSPLSVGTPLITPVGNGWFRVSVTGSIVASTENLRVGLIRNFTPNGTDGLLVWGAQLEAASFASSYVPTTASAATRASDIAAITNLTNIGFNPVQGTTIVEAEVMRADSGVTQGLVSFSDGTFNNRMTHFVGTTGGNGLFAATGGATQYNGGAGVTLTDNTMFKSGFAYAANDLFTSCNGSSPVGTTTFTLPTVTQLEIGRIVSVGSAPLFGWLRRIVYYPTRLPNAQLQSLTT